MVDNTYAELCVVKAAVLAKIPKGLDLIEAASAATGDSNPANQLLAATEVKSGPDGAGRRARQEMSGRSAVFAAKQRGATVIGGVLKRQADAAKTAGVDQVVATDDDAAISALPPVHAVADTVGGEILAEKLIARVKTGSVCSLLLMEPRRTPHSYPSVKAVFVSSKSSTGRRSSLWQQRCGTASWSSR